MIADTELGNTQTLELSLETPVSELPSISIIIPTYNAENYIALTLESVLAQTVTAWMLTVVDDGSYDGTVAILQAFAARDTRIHLVLQQNEGAVAARNRGLSAIHPATQYVILLDHDDVWEPQALEILKRALETYPEAVAAHGVIHAIDDQGRLSESSVVDKCIHHRQAVVDDRVVPWPISSPMSFAALCIDNWIVTPGSVLIRRSALERVGTFDPAVYPCDDWDLWLRLSRLGDILSLDTPVLKYRLHSSNASQNLRRMHEASRHFHAKAIASHENSPEQRRMLRVWQKHHRISQWHFCLKMNKEALVNIRRRQFLQAAKQWYQGLYVFIRFATAQL